VATVLVVHDANKVWDAVIRDEVENTMRLLGVTKLSQLSPAFVNTKALDHLICDPPYEK